MREKPCDASDDDCSASTKQAGWVTVYDERYTNLRRRVRADSSAARRLPHSSPLPLSVTPEQMAALYPEGQPGVEK